MEEKNTVQEIRKPRVVNLGIQTFYNALKEQGVECAQIEWQPPVKQDAEIENLLNMFL